MSMYERTALMLGEEAIGMLRHARVCVFGLGGVGGACAEALARAGVGTLTLVDGDVVADSNRNRQVIALSSNIGQKKANVCANRLLCINPDARVIPVAAFFCAESAEQFDFSEYDYVVDAIDSVPDKLLIIERAKHAGTPVISCMGAGNKLDPMGFLADDIENTSVCPLARVMRREIKKRGLGHVRVVYSRETPVKPELGERRTPGSVSFVPPAAGLLLAREVILALIART